MNPLRYAPFVPRLLSKRGRPILLTFFVTNRCQCRCLHCFYWRQLGPSADGELTLAEVDRVARSVGALLWLSLTGGEPFLRDDLVDLARLFGRRNRPRHLTVVTNGQWPERVAEMLPRLLAASPESFVHLVLSVDGMAESHNRLRQTPGAFERATQTAAEVARVRESHPHLGLTVNTVFHRFNQGEIAELERHVREVIRADFWDISLVRGAVRDASVQEVDRTAFLAWKEHLEGLLTQRAIPYFRYPLARLGLARQLVLDEHLRSYRERPRLLVPCQAGRLSAVLYPDGEVAACEADGYGMGNVRDFGCDLAELWRSSKAAQVRRRIRSQGCHCDHGCNLVTNLTFHPRTSWSILRRFLRQR